MKRIALLLLLTSSILICGCSDKSLESSSNPVNKETSSVSDDDILSNPKNEVGNGYVIIHDESDYPSCLKDFRYDCGGRVIDYWGNEVFSVSENDLLFSCGVSAHRFDNGLYGFYDNYSRTVFKRS